VTLTLRTLGAALALFAASLSPLRAQVEPPLPDPPRYRILPEEPDPLVLRGLFARTELGRYCTVCPERDRFGEDAAQFLLLALAASGIDRGTSDGVLKPRGGTWRRNLGDFRFYDGDRWQTDALLHPAAATATYLALRQRGYSRAGAAVFLLAALTAREFAVKAWSTPVALDDPLIFAASGVVLGTLIEEFTPLEGWFAAADPGRHLPAGVRFYWSPTRITAEW